MSEEVKEQEEPQAVPSEEQETPQEETTQESIEEEPKGPDVEAQISALSDRLSALEAILSAQLVQEDPEPEEQDECETPSQDVDEIDKFLEQ